MKVKLLLTFLGFLFLFNCVPEKDVHAPALAILPENTPIVIKINDYDTFSSEIKENEIIKSFQNSEGINQLTDLLQPLKHIKSSLGGYLAFIDLTKDNIGFVYIPNDSLPQVVIDSTTNKIIEKISKGMSTMNRYEIDGNIFYTSIIENKEIVGSSEAVIEMVWKTLDNSTLPKEQFMRFDQMDNLTKSAQIWIDLNNGQNFVHKFLDTQSDSDAFGYADWLSLDISANDDSLILNGISIVQDTVQKYLRLFSNSRPVSNGTTKLAPEQSGSFISFTFNDYKNFSRNQKGFTDELGTNDSIFSVVEEIGISQWYDEKVVLLKTYGKENVADYINGLQTGSLDYQGSEIKELKKDSLLQLSFYPLLEDFDLNFATVMENTFAFSTTKETLEQFINSNKLGQTFEKSLLFENVQELITEESSILSVSNTENITKNLQLTGLGVFTEVIKKANLKNHLFGSQIISDAGFLHTNFFIKKISASGKKTGTSEMFKTQLDADIYMNPQFFTNHRTKRKDIVVQDQDNVLYLVTNKGTIIWKKQLESAIQGKIHEVDIYRNGKYQLAFTTNNRFYVIDRNGKEVAPFTFKYEGGNLNPLAVFDYANNKTYRFVVTQGDKVYMYNNEGKIVSGYKYTKAEDSILGAPQHFVIGTRDYLVFKLANGNLKILDRVGRDRIKVSEKISFSDNDIKVHQNKFIVSSKDGILYEINSRGEIQNSNLQVNEDHGMDATSRTLVIMNDNILSIRGKKVTLDLGVYTKPSIFYLNDKIYVSVTDIQNLKTYLFDSQAEPITGFPVYGASTIDMADMDNDNRPELVLKDQENSLVVYKVH